MSNSVVGVGFADELLKLAGEGWIGDWPHGWYKDEANPEMSIARGRARNEVFRRQTVRKKLNRRKQRKANPPKPAAGTTQAVTAPVAPSAPTPAVATKPRKRRRKVVAKPTSTTSSAPAVPRAPDPGERTYNAYQRPRHGPNYSRRR